MSVKPEVEKAIRDTVESLLAVRLENLDLKEELAEALWHLDGVLNNLPEEMEHRFGGSRNFLARHAQAEQQGDSHEDDERKAKPGLYCRDCGTRLMVKGVCSIYCPNKDCGDTKIEQQEAQGAQAGDETNIQAYQRGWNDRAALATQPSIELVGYANFDQLDNMLGDRTATLHPKKTGFAGTPVYRALATQPAVRGAEHE